MDISVVLYAFVTFYIVLSDTKISHTNHAGDKYTLYLSECIIGLKEGRGLVFHVTRMSTARLLVATYRWYTKVYQLH